MSLVKIALGVVGVAMVGYGLHHIRVGAREELSQIKAMCDDFADSDGLNIPSFGDVSPACIKAMIKISDTNYRQCKENDDIIKSARYCEFSNALRCELIRRGVAVPDFKC